MSYVHTNSKGVQYHLNCQESELRGGHKQMTYFFSKDARATACDLPSDREVVENKVNGVPFLRKRK